MVLLTITPAAQAAINAFCRLKESRGEVEGSEDNTRLDRLYKIQVGSQIEHDELVAVSQYLVKDARADGDDIADQWRLDTLLKGAAIYQQPPPPKPEPAPEYKALMKRLREQEEQRQYERMVKPPFQPETFNQRFPNSRSSSASAAFIGGYDETDEVDEMTYDEVNRQMILIINVLVSIVACSVAVWMAARRWSVPSRMALAFSASTVVAVAEVAIYMGYIKRISDAKTVERKKVEKKEVIDTWVIDAKSNSVSTRANESMHYRKGKHR